MSLNDFRDQESTPEPTYEYRVVDCEGDVTDAPLFTMSEAEASVAHHTREFGLYAPYRIQRAVWEELREECAHPFHAPAPSVDERLVCHCEVTEHAPGCPAWGL